MRKFVKIAFVAVFAAAMGYGVYTSQKSEVLSDLALANVEALAGCGESSSVTYYRSLQAENGCHCFFCPDGDSNCKCKST